MRNDRENVLVDKSFQYALQINKTKQLPLQFSAFYL